MRKVFMKSFLGIPLAIFLYEIINIIFSITVFQNQYFRLDMFDLKEIITIYIELAIIGYILFFSMYYEMFLRNSGKKENEIAKKSATIMVITFILIIFGLMFTVDSNSYAIAISCPIIIIIFGVIGAIKGFSDENTIKKINKKIKEIQEKKD